jgi:hypothetical protein
VRAVSGQLLGAWQLVMHRWHDAAELLGTNWLGPIVVGQLARCSLVVCRLCAAVVMG